MHDWTHHKKFSGCGHPSSKLLDFVANKQFCGGLRPSIVVLQDGIRFRTCKAAILLLNIPISQLPTRKFRQRVP
jgi:hypothetical protein